MVVRDTTGTTDIGLMMSVEPTSGISYCKFNIIIIIMISTFCVVALENLLFKVFVILLYVFAVENALLIIVIISFCLYHCYQRKNRFIKLNKGIILLFITVIFYL